MKCQILIWLKFSLATNIIANLEVQSSQLFEDQAHNFSISMLDDLEENCVVNKFY